MEKLAFISVVLKQIVNTSWRRKVKSLIFLHLKYNNNDNNNKTHNN